MSFLDQLGQGLMGAAGGYLTGGLGGALTGGLTGGLMQGNKPITLGSALGNTAASSAAGYLGGQLLGTQRPTFGSQPQPGVTTGPQRPQNMDAYGNLIYGPQQKPGFFSNMLTGAENLGGSALGGLEKLGGSAVKKLGYGGVIGALGSLGGAGNSAMGAVGGLFGSHPQQQAPQQQGGPQGGGMGQQRPSGAGYGFGNGQYMGGAYPQMQAQGPSPMQGLATLGGLGLGAYGLTQGAGQLPSMAAPYAGLQNQTASGIQGGLAANQGAVNAAQAQLTANQDAARQALETDIGAGSQAAMQNYVRQSQDQLAAQGLLNGSGTNGAMNDAVAEAAARLRASQLPALEQAELQGMQSQDMLAQGGLDAALGLQNAGLSRQFGLQDQQSQASLRDQLMQYQQQQQRQQALMQAAGGMLGYGAGGTAQAAQAGAGIGSGLDRIFAGV